MADQKVLAEEVFAFVRAAMAIDSSLSEARLHAWFSNNRPRLRSRLNHPDFSNWLLHCLDSVEVDHKPERVLKHLAEIAAADQNVHVSEKALIVLAARHWGVEHPAFSAP